MMLYRIPLLTLPIYRIGVVLTELAALATLVSMVAYLRAAWPDSGAECASFLDFAGPALKIPCLTRDAGIAQLVERNLAKVEVASSSLVSRSIIPLGTAT